MTEFGFNGSIRESQKFVIFLDNITDFYEADKAFQYIFQKARY